MSREHIAKLGNLVKCARYPNKSGYYGHEHSILQRATKIKITGRLSHDVKEEKVENKTY